MNRTELFAAVRPFAPGQKLTPEMVTMIDDLGDRFGLPRVGTVPAGGPVTMKVAMETVSHEAIVLEAYLDSEKVWTWSVGLTAASGVDPLAYKDKPAPLSACLSAYVDRLRNKYAPEVVKAFTGASLTEAQFAAALSFHWNTGAIGRTDWVTLFLAGKQREARAFLETHYLNGGDLKERRMREAALFFDGKWTQGSTVAVVPVSKPSYQPNFRQAKQVNITADLALAMGAAA